MLADTHVTASTSSSPTARQIASDYLMAIKKLPPPPPPPFISSGATGLILLSVAFAAAVFATWHHAPTSSGLSARRVYSLSAALLAGSTLLLTALEPEISAVDALYLCVMTFTTIGYGDIAHPVSTGGRAVVMCLALGGIAFFSVTIELFHAAREATDGALIRKLGLNGHVAAFAMLAVNAIIGVVLCQCLSEDPELPKQSIFDGVYWSIITGTSVGFGDHHPTSDVGKLAVCAYALLSMQAAGNAMDFGREYLETLCTVTMEKAGASSARAPMMRQATSPSFNVRRQSTSASYSVKRIA